MNKEQFRQQLATVENQNTILRELLDTLIYDQFEFTAEGARDQYKVLYGENDALCARSWMLEHYDSIAAITRAASLIADTLAKTLEPLWLEAGKLIKEEEENPNG